MAMSSPPIPRADENVDLYFITSAIAIKIKLPFCVCVCVCVYLGSIHIHTHTHTHAAYLAVHRAHVSIRQHTPAYASIRQHTFFVVHRGYCLTQGEVVRSMRERVRKRGF